MRRRSDGEALRQLLEASTPHKENFYRAFEDRFRGSRELIKRRLEQYRRFFRPLMELHSGSSALDLGCGRGEWLELLRDDGFTAEGVDLDSGMLAACRTLGLNVSEEDALVRLRSSASDSVSVISAFHLVEHLEFGVLMDLISEALRVLRPGGLLILETPNPENLTVGACSFYLDPTHQRPVPPLLLSFLVEFAGFIRPTVLRLQEPPHVLAKEDIAIIDILEAVSPDYAVVAQKGGDAASASILDEAFSISQGVSLRALNSRFEARLEMTQETLRDSAAALERLRKDLDTVRLELAEVKRAPFSRWVGRYLRR